MAQKKPEMADLVSVLHEKPTDSGLNAKELKSLKRTGKYLFTITEQQGPDKLTFIEVSWTETETETEILKERYQSHMHTRIIADCLGRKEASIKAKIAYFAEYFKELKEVSLYEGPQALSPAQETSIFHYCLMEIWEGWMTFSETHNWDEIISTLPLELWLSLIAEHIPKHSKYMLDSYQLPSIVRMV